jgi:hypothetical protein
MTSDVRHRWTADTAYSIRPLTTLLSRAEGVPLDEIESDVAP